MDPAQAFEAREIARYKYINETIDQAQAQGDSSIQQFYDDAVVLVTGAGGFLGKQLIEKLFRACRIKKVYVILRSKNDKTIKERWAKVMQDQVFEYLQETQPDFLSKIVPIEGDMTLPGLGINKNDWKIITDNVNIIFHGAATVNFAESLRKATMTNVHGAREMIRLARDCKKLKLYVHISTAYTHATLANEGRDVLEHFYQSPMSPEALINTVDSVDDANLDIMTPQIMKGWPNTYAFTKAVAEELVRTVEKVLPICIVRPAIVVSAYREPLPGWIDKTSAFGASGIVIGLALGVLHVLYANYDTNVDLVPVDIVNNATIAAAHETAVRRACGFSYAKIYTVCSTRNPLGFGTLVEYITYEGRKFSTNASVWYGYAIIIKNTILHNLLFFLMHYVPGFIVDGMLLLIGKKPILTKIYNKVYKLNTAVGFYLRHNWRFGDSNLLELYCGMSPVDRIIFNCDMVNIDWVSYIVLWCIGCRKYIIKDGLKDTVKAVRKQNIFRIFNYVVVVGYTYLIYKIVISLFRVIYNIFL